MLLFIVWICTIIQIPICFQCSSILRWLDFEVSTFLIKNFMCICRYVHACMGLCAACACVCLQRPEFIGSPDAGCEPLDVSAGEESARVTSTCNLWAISPVPGPYFLIGGVLWWTNSWTVHWEVIAAVEGGVQLEEADHGRCHWRAKDLILLILVPASLSSDSQR